MADDFRLRLRHKVFDFDFSCEAAQIVDILKCPHDQDVELTADNNWVEGSEMKVMLSPRALASFSFGALALSPARMHRALSDRRYRFAISIASFLNTTLQRDGWSADAWNSGCVEIDFRATHARQDYGSFPKKCAAFDLKSLRWRLTPTGVEIDDIVVCEHFDTFSEWEERQGDLYADKDEDDKHWAWLEDLEVDVWPVSYVRLTLKMSHGCLAEILACRSELTATDDGGGPGSEEFQQWTDIYATLAMVLTRLPGDDEMTSDAKLRAALAPIKTTLHGNRWPAAKRPLRKFTRAPAKKYRGFPPSP